LSIDVWSGGMKVVVGRPAQFQDEIAEQFGKDDGRKLVNLGA